MPQIHRRYLLLFPLADWTFEGSFFCGVPDIALYRLSTVPSLFELHLEKKSHQERNGCNNKTTYVAPRLYLKGGDHGNLPTPVDFHPMDDGRERKLLLLLPFFFVEILLVGCTRILFDYRTFSR